MRGAWAWPIANRPQIANLPHKDWIGVWNDRSGSGGRGLEEVRQHGGCVRVEFERASAECVWVSRAEWRREVDDDSDGARPSASRPGHDLSVWEAFGGGTDCVAAADRVAGGIAVAVFAFDGSRKSGGSSAPDGVGEAG